MNRHRTLGFLIALMLAVSLSPRRPSSFATAAPDETKARDAEESEETTRLIVAELPNWKLWKGTDRKTGLKLEAKSVLRWSRDCSAS